MNEKEYEEIERIIASYQDMLFRFAYFRTGSLTDSEDIVQEIFLKMLDGKIDLSRIGNLKNYLFRSISNSCSDYYRKRTKAPLPLDKVRVPDSDANDEPWKGEYERINRLLEEIPFEQAEIIRMRCIDGLHFSEIADIIGIRVATVKSRFRYGIDKIRSLNHNKS